MPKQCITERMKTHILVMDGAMGTMLHLFQLTAMDFGGEQYEGCNDYLNITASEVVANVHNAYFESGADVIVTNTLGATKVVLDEYNLGSHVYEINKRGSEIAATVAKKYTTAERPRYVAGSMGPTTKMLSLTGGITFDELVCNFTEQALGMIDGGIDFFLIETAQDTLNVKAAYLGIIQAQNKRCIKLPLMISGTIETNGTILSGQNIEAFYISLAHMKPFAIGINCATSPTEMNEHIRTLSSIASCGVSCYPNIGIPDENGCYNESHEEFALKLAKLVEAGWLNIVGGCCGTTPSHIAAICDKVNSKKPRTFEYMNTHSISGLEPLNDSELNKLRPIMVGERTNVFGSRKFGKLIRDGYFEEAAEIGLEQVKKGAHIIDVCLADPESNELVNMDKFMKLLTNKVKVPLMIDSMDSKVVETALKRSQGKCIINSVNLEKGEDQLEAISILIHQYGAAIVVGTIDEQGMAVSARDKLRIANRAYDLLTVKYGILPEDIIFDPLVFPVGTGDVAYLSSAKETIEGIRLIKEAYPSVQTILGLSNISFGLPPAGREILNSVFLYHCVEAGLDYAIVNTENLEPFASISEDEVKLASDLLFNTSDETLATFADFYRNKKAVIRRDVIRLTLEERLARYVATGTKNGMIEDLIEARAKYKNPIDIVNGPLMDGMMKVGDLFNGNQLIVAEVLQSAGVMRAAVSHLESFMEAGVASATKGKFVLATIKGDVHDIGKNLVEIIMSNNGYDVIDLGIKVETQTIINAVRDYNPDVIGLSGLLIKSAQQMILTAGDMKKAGINVPIIVGGAALSRKFANKIAAVYDGIVMYAKDAMHGLELVNELMTPDGRARLTTKHIALKNPASTNAPKTQQIATSPSAAPKVSTFPRDLPVAIPTNTKRHVVVATNQELASYIDKQRLYGHHLGAKGKIEELLANDDEKVVKIKQLTEDINVKADIEGWVTPKGIYQFFPAQSMGNQVIVYDPSNIEHIIEIFDFPRQLKKPHLCLADYLKSVESGEMDYIGFFVVTSGIQYVKRVQQLKEDGQFLESHVLSSLALESAEAMAEFIHKKMRADLGVSDLSVLPINNNFDAKYQSGRFSFGYPSCPDLAMQEQLFRILKPEVIGVSLTEGYMMESVASASAMVVSHLEARYFSIY